MRNLIIALVIFPLPTLAGEGMSAEEFDAFTQGKVLNFAVNGAHYGAEEYLPGNRVRWSFLDGKCLDGAWWEDAGNICFAYQNEPLTQCWSFTETAAGLSARFADDPPDGPRYQAWGSDQPLFCLGPEVGV